MPFVTPLVPRITIAFSCSEEHAEGAVGDLLRIYWDLWLWISDEIQSIEEGPNSFVRFQKQKSQWWDADAE